MKKRNLLIMVVCMVLLCACGSETTTPEPAKAPESVTDSSERADTSDVAPTSAPDNNSADSEKSDEKKKPPKLTGKWESKRSPKMYMAGEIKGNKIEIYWIDVKNDNEYLYWSGSFKAPKSAKSVYKWKSKGNTQKMKTSLLASRDKSKVFTYKNKTISFKATALGITKNIKMKRVKK